MPCSQIALRDWVANLELGGTVATLEGRAALAERLVSELNQLRRRLDTAIPGRPRVEDGPGDSDR
jgi:hypothetical protein